MNKRKDVILMNFESKSLDITRGSFCKIFKMNVKIRNELTLSMALNMIRVGVSLFKSSKL